MDTVKRILTDVVFPDAACIFIMTDLSGKFESTRRVKSLGLAGETADVVARRDMVPSWAWHGLKWVAVFVVPLGALWFWQTRLPVPDVTTDSVVGRGCA